MSRDYMTLDIIKTINPYSGAFYRYGDSFLQINTIGSTMWVVQVVGKGKDWLGALWKSAKKSDIKDIMWMTNVNNRTVNTWAKYLNADLIEVIPNHYGEYSANHWCLSLEKPNKRFDIVG
jgi:hypothetical protein